LFIFLHKLEVYPATLRLLFSDYSFSLIPPDFRFVMKAKGKASTARPDAKSNPTRKASGGSSDQVPKKAHSEKFCQHCKAHGGPYQMHNTSYCRCYDKDGKPLGAAAGKPSKSKKPYKKFGGNKSMAFMQTMFEAYAKAKKASKSKKHKEHKYDSSRSSNSE
jgi:hypothetical protein